MALVFDGVGYMQRLRDAGVAQEQAEAHAQAVRDFVMLELVTRNDLEAAMDRLSLRLTVRMGVMFAAGLTILGAVLKLHS
jgi:hypothetical protein